MAETGLRAAKHEENRNAILDAAEVEFSTAGFAKSSLKNIATAAGVSRPLLYRHFNNKEALFDAVVLRINHEWQAVLVREATRTTPSTAHTMRKILIASNDFARRRQFVSRLLAQDTRVVLESFSDATRQGRAMLRQLIEDVLRRGVEQRDVRNDVDVEDMAHVISEVYLSYAEYIIAGEDEELTARRIEAVMETLFHGFVASR